MRWAWHLGFPWVPPDTSEDRLRYQVSRTDVNFCAKCSLVLQPRQTLFFGSQRDPVSHLNISEPPEDMEGLWGLSHGNMRKKLKVSEDLPVSFTHVFTLHPFSQFSEKESHNKKLHVILFPVISGYLQWLMGKQMWLPLQ